MTNRKRVLVVEDDATIGRVLADNLGFAGFDVEWVTTGEAGLEMARTSAPDMILLDVMLPDADGFELCARLRKQSQTPIIMLTARVQRADKVQGLAIGADDYVTKPFHMEELLARIHAVLRRALLTVTQLRLGTLTVDFVRLTASNDRGALHLTHREFEVLRYLAERQGVTVSRDDLLRNIWGYLDVPDTRMVDHTIARLRKKVERAPARPRFIQTVLGDGYVLTAGTASRTGGKREV